MENKKPIDTKIYAHLSVAQNTLLDHRLRKLAYEIVMENAGQEINNLAELKEKENG